MVSSAQAPETPDPVALAQGHRLQRLAFVLTLPAWLIGGVLIIWLGPWAIFEGRHHIRLPTQRFPPPGLEAWLVPAVLIAVVVLAVVGAALAFAFAVRLLRPGLPELRARSRSAGAPSTELSALSIRVEQCARRLERGEDRAFVLDATELGLELAHLDARTREQLDERGVCYQGLQASLAELDLGRRLTPARRRALYHQLQQLLTGTRSRSASSPYRSPATPSGGEGHLAWLRDGSPNDRQLRRVRAWMWLACVMLVEAALASSLVVCDSMYQYSKWGRCVWSVAEAARPFRRCEFALDPAKIVVPLLGLLPLMAAIAAVVAKRCARASFELALPSVGPSPSSSKLSRRFAAARTIVCLRRAWLWVVSATPVTVLVCSFSALVCVSCEIHRMKPWPARGLELIEIAYLTMLLAVACVLVVGGSTRLRDAIALRRLASSRRRCGDATVADHLGQLGALRARLATGAPNRRHLEALAAELDACAGLGALAPDDAALVRARIEAAAARGPALGQRELRHLGLALETCEYLLAAPRVGPVRCPA